MKKKKKRKKEDKVQRNVDIKIEAYSLNSEHSNVMVVSSYVLERLPVRIWTGILDILTVNCCCFLEFILVNTTADHERLLPRPFESITHNHNFVIRGE